MRRLASVLLWSGISALGAAGFGVLALSRGETVNAAWLLVAAVCTYAVAYRFYSRFLAARVFGLDERRATPAERFNNGRDFVPTNKWVLYGHHFAAIAGAGPLVGPVLAAQFGFLPGTIWLVIGVVLGGAVQDFTILFCSLRRDGKSLGQMAKEEVNPAAGAMAMLAVLFIMIILLAVLALIVVNALRASPWGLFTIACTVPIALLMGWWMKVWRPGRVGEASVAGASPTRPGRHTFIHHPIRSAIGTVHAIVNSPQGDALSAFTTMSASTASRMIMMNSTASIAIAPAAGLTSSFAIWPSDLPSRRSEQNRIVKSCTAPPSTTPITSQIVPGRKPNWAASTGPTSGPAPAMAAKWCPYSTHLLVGTKSRPLLNRSAGVARRSSRPNTRAARNRE